MFISTSTVILIISTQASQTQASNLRKGIWVSISVLDRIRGNRRPAQNARKEVNVPSLRISLIQEILITHIKAALRLLLLRPALLLKCLRPLQPKPLLGSPKLAQARTSLHSKASTRQTKLPPGKALLLGHSLRLDRCSPITLKLPLSLLKSLLTASPFNV
jgi:hypothetical protein